MSLQPFYRGRRVFVTGHTGFKGSWLTMLLSFCGAEIYGFSLESPVSHPSMFDILDIGSQVAQGFGDIRDPLLIARHVHEFDPEIVLHLAAQPLVGEGYRDPSKTFETNVMGTVNLLEACKNAPSLRTIIVVTSDKCYLNRSAHDRRPFAEDDPLGGDDPYSASKAAQEFVTQSYRQSWFKSRGVGVASVRAGNVIGGGDWAPGRVVPDVVRAILSGTPLAIRYPDSIRPWQHVLEPLAGYLRLGQMLCRNPMLYSGAWNFGPSGQEYTVRELVESLLLHWGRQIPLGTENPGLPESPYLTVNSSKASTLLGWHPTLGFAATVRRTVQWYQAYANSRTSQAMRDFTSHQIRTMVRTAMENSETWAEVFM